MKWLRVSCVFLAGSLLGAGWSCGSSAPNNGFPGGDNHDASASSSGGGGEGGSFGGDDGPGFGGFGDGGPQTEDSGGNTGCTNLQCQVHSCGGSGDGGASTTLTGTVLDPAGRNPLYNVVVYIPNATGGVLSPIPIGINSDSCSCGALFSGEPIAATVTDTSGNFTLTNVPDGANIPVVVQIGKWRKEIIVPSITQCGTTSAGKITLPKSLTDGKYASIPNIAVSTGGLDSLECLLTRVGVDESFFTGDPNGPGIHIFQGAGGNAAAGSPSSPKSLWDSQADLMRYDIIMFSCEGAPTTGVDSTTATYMGPYISAGGRVFAEHYHYAFFTGYAGGVATPFPQFTNVANWVNVGESANDAPYNNDIANNIQTTLPSGKAFPEGSALKSWLGTVGALNSSQELVVPLENARDNATVSASNVGTPWTQTASGVSPASTQYFSWDMPFNPPVSDAGVPEYCGRAVYSDMHVSGSANDYGTSDVVPTGCDATSALDADEDAIEFILFDLSSCITPVGFTPKPPQPEGGIAQ